ncbi:hypothetical protein GCM10017044_15530 [Kordiimonas sediminis]|uniref:Tox-ART-HYD1 domain-containing protein n=1 Tax=Kordiimonas sediminis TaxID=1735581 RepID=A0A919E7J4_9PROT|nr:hypothetical protein GCM10017044_15530 [Kordiimonas sediminis]
MTHFTNSKDVDGTQDSGPNKAGDQNSVFTVGTKSKEAKSSPQDVQGKLGIGMGRGNNSVAFDTKSSEIIEVKNPVT